ncbi:class A beta-lactamase-related serine hydrolase [Herbiconiux sp. CPCC 205716]|uniref:Class A beta-lactamase-related serine hydrolase n=1 Tax=Herbiconiux gentiana TaxID=2970912 RepID=A0ABT2GI67_9MICO|nr:serine hydrolase [Herbiconiux gentiana]MCS5715917.1 class A beta-lactamase-related serine hydrolase [Herbiconiux gentiana]
MPESIRRRAREDRDEAAPRGRRSDAIENDGGIFRKGFASLTELALSGVQVTACAVDLGSGKVLFSVDDHLSVPTASIGKVLLLIEVAARISARDGSSTESRPRPVRPGPGAEALSILNRTAGDEIADSGLWQHLQVPALPVSDLAALIGATSDNLATNVLLRRIGLDTVRARAESLGLRRTLLLDIVREERGPDDAPQLSVGSARELAILFGRLHAGTVVDETTSRLVRGWLSLGTDLSLVASAFGLDPLAHVEADHGLRLFNKTGTDAGIRSEAGVITGPQGGISYAVTMRFNDAELSGRLAVLDAMRVLGTDFLEYVY